MEFILQPWQLYFVILAGWINRQQQEVIEYLRTENRVLREKLGKKRILLSDDQRRRLSPPQGHRVTKCLLIRHFAVVRLTLLARRQNSCPFQLGRIKA